MSKKITLLGSTGSIGTQSLDVIRAQGYEVFGLSAHSALHGLVGADDRSQLAPAERTARKVGRGVAAPGKAEDQQNEINRVIAIFCKGQHPL